MIHQAVFTIESDSAAIVYHALIPEQEDETKERSEGTCSLITDNILEISIHACDLSALRAALNTWLRLVQVATEVIERAKI
jgi:KEOPS complex subunit Pcc1